MCGESAPPSGGFEHWADNTRRRSLLATAQVRVGQPVLAVQPVPSPVCFPELTEAPLTTLRDGHPGRVKEWMGLEHVIVDWFGLEASAESTWVGYGRNDDLLYPGLRATDDTDYQFRCRELLGSWWFLRPPLMSLRQAWIDAQARLYAAEQGGADGDTLDELRPQVLEAERSYLKAALPYMRAEGLL